MAKWFVLRQGKEDGPLSPNELRQLAASDELKPTDSIRREDMNQWVIANTAKGLFETKNAEPKVFDATLVDEPPITPVGPPPLPPSENQGVSGDVLNRAKELLTEFTGTAKQAGQLAAAHARKKQLTMFTLPNAYSALGERVFVDGRHRLEFESHYLAIESVQSQLNGLKSSIPPNRDAGVKSVISRAACLINTKGQQAKLSFKLASLFRGLGENVFQSHPESLGPDENIRLINECLSDIENLNEEIVHLSNSGSGKLLTPTRMAFGLGLSLLVIAFMTTAIIGSRPSLVTAPDFSNVDYSFDFTHVDYTALPEGAERKIKDVVFESTNQDLNGKLATLNGYVDKEGKFFRHGKCVTWREDDKSQAIREHMAYRGKLHGKMIGWHSNGSKSYEFQFVEDEQHGVQREWYSDGTLYSEYYFYNGHLHGPSREWYSNGKLRKKSFWSVGRLHGPFVEYGDAGAQITVRGQFANGKPVGMWQPPSSPDEFIRRMELLGAHGQKLYNTDHNLDFFWEQRRFFAISGNYPFEDWVQVFGEPEDVRNGPGSSFVNDVWKHTYPTFSVYVSGVLISGNYHSNYRHWDEQNWSVGVFVISFE